MLILVVAVLLGVATGLLAQSKGRNFFGWFLLGGFLPVVGLILAFTVPTIERNVDQRALRTGTRRRCPFCAEMIRSDAAVCRFCGRDLPESRVDTDMLASLKANDLQHRH